MNTAGSVANGSFRLDSSRPGAAPEAFDAFLDKWRTQVGDGFPMPNFSADTVGDFRVKARAARIGDVALTEMSMPSALRTEGPLGGAEDQVRLYVVRRGGWTLAGSAREGGHTVAAGQVLLRHVGRPVHFETAPGTTAKVLVLPSGVLAPLLGNRSLTGPADAAEVRLLAAHADMVHTTSGGLGPAGLRAAHSTLIELAKAVALGRFDDVEPRLAPALAQAAKDVADEMLADPELSATTLAHRLNVSVRTLHRAFAATEESVSAYIRRRRLEEARLALSTAHERLSVSELAAHWHFADSSHFTRAFKRHYGQTPTDYVRTAAAQGPRRPWQGQAAGL
ncbi:helix-turn-helix domain-containing protein [Streptacidiphilus anmyonensis]|uniref:helix-turn-helix domain-containing protein n=1 Tax=Streptacidiphilus anmyonensis TaxID=405782 RepID=UPI0005A8D0A5|nr:helix-turn-helix domain-containing protein [Streptacidiphilus anmyonensis]